MNLYRKDVTKLKTIEKKVADDLVELKKRGRWDHPITEISGEIKSHLKSINQTHAIPYVHEVLPFKFKEITNIGKDFPFLEQYEDMNEEILVRDSSQVLLADDVRKTNINYCLRLERTIKILQSLKHSLETDTLFETEIPEKELEEFLLRWDGAINRCSEILDGRHQVMPSTQHMLFYALSVSTLNYTYSTYVRFIRDFERMTPKQAEQRIKGLLK